MATVSEIQELRRLAAQLADASTTLQDSKNAGAHEITHPVSGKGITSDVPQSHINELQNEMEAALTDLTNHLDSIDLSNVQT